MDINLYNGDCMEAMRAMPDKAYDLAIVDPPYGLNIISKKGKVGATGAKQYLYKEWDSASPPVEYFIELKRVSKNQIVWGANHFISKIPYDSSCWIIWDKMQRDFSFADGEMAWTSFKSALRFVQISRGELVSEGKIHPTQKPVALYKWLLKNYAQPGDKILDTHGGSMSIAIACHEMGFALDLWELDADYHAAGVARFEQHKRQQQLFKPQDVVNFKEPQLL